MVLAKKALWKRKYLKVNATMLKIRRNAEMEYQSLKTGWRNEKFNVAFREDNLL